jgi:hypothetical protein
MATGINVSKPIKVLDEGTQIAPDINQINFTGTGVTATASGNDVTVNVTGAGGGLQGVHALLPLASGEQTNSAVTTQAMSSSAMVANRLYAYPFISAQNITTSNLYINVNGFLAGSLARILIYSDLNGRPDQKLYESSNLDCSTNGQKTATTTFNFVAGTRYWLTLHSSSTQTLTSFATTSLINIKTNGISMGVYYYDAPTFGSAPTTFSIVGTQTTGAPFIGITKV